MFFIVVVVVVVVVIVVVPGRGGRDGNASFVGIYQIKQNPD